MSEIKNIKKVTDFSNYPEGTVAAVQYEANGMHYDIFQTVGKPSTAVYPGKPPTAVYLPDSARDTTAKGVLRFDAGPSLRVKKPKNPYVAKRKRPL